MPEPIEPNQNMKRLKSIALAGTLAVACMELLGGCSKNDNTHQIANTYFRMGEEAALVARDRQDAVEREMRRRYPNNVFTNEADFEAANHSVNIIDDPRIFQVVRELNNGSVCGLDTNDWSGLYTSTTRRDPHIWTVLRW